MLKIFSGEGSRRFEVKCY
jgi:hypothetical protein